MNRRSYPFGRLFGILILLSRHQIVSNAFVVHRQPRVVTTHHDWHQSQPRSKPFRYSKSPSYNQQRPLHMSNNLSFYGASAALMGCSLVGIQVDRMVPSCGIAVTLILAAILSNTAPWVPATHSLYDLCWTLFLPASLTLLLLAYKKDPCIDSEDKSDKEASILACVRRVSLPFVIASIGSLFGCWTSYRCALAFDWFSIENARAATACLSASYVGGSVNFFSAARLISADKSLLGSLATADLITMALYFSFLSASLDSKVFNSLFQGKKKDKEKFQTTVVETKSNSEISESQQRPSFLKTTMTLISNSLASIPLLGLTLGIVLAANRVESFLGRWIPGTACAVIALVAPLVNSLVHQKTWWLRLSKTANPLADFLFLAFFASIGIGVNLETLAQMGPSCILFSLLALSIHLGVALLGSLPFRSILDLEDVWIASNAAIGGPATAAAFVCNQMKNKNPSKLRGRTMAATVFGVFGYAIGTILGTLMFQFVGGRL